ncbi:hypothetical protein TWF718_009654 [Orbilia javanica]|uniref:Uncharacterized protein n=1 Tax=Orbilia javanica TaxID=47235 RepID=A0AAN8REW5_9PEZI
MSLESGVYTIKCKLNGNLVGRHPVEDRSANPKPVYALGADNVPPQWVVERCEEGYTLSNGGGRAASIDGKIFVILVEEEFSTAETWVIEAQPHQGENLYTVKTKDQSKAWSQTAEVGGEPETFILAVDYYSVKESLPVQYLPQNLFEFTPIVDTED